MGTIAWHRQPCRWLPVAVSWFGSLLLLALFTAGQLQAATPTITSFTPTSGFPGTTMVIAGSNFTGTGSVTFNSTAAGHHQPA